ncbi:MAG: alpha/beta fold hydrolase [Deltaproteobacteria bacterium]|nr:alpha/beta fold hydrolase [Deltaproteobacteria bacterium]
MPALAAQFFRPRQRLQLAPPTDATPLSVTHGDLALQGWALGQGPAVLLAHGWEGAAGQFGPMAQALTAQGLRAVAFDLPAHGASGGVEANVVTFAAALREVARAHGPFVGVVGHSLGGAAVSVASATGLGAERALLIAPAASPDHFIRTFAGAVLPPELLGPFTDAVWAHAGFVSQDVHAPSHVSRFDGTVRVLHDPADREVPFAHGESIAAAAKAGSLRELPGAGHVRILTDARTLDETTHFFAPLRRTSEASHV